MKKIKKKKAFIGGVFDSIANIINQQKQNELQQRQYEKQQGLIFKQENQQLANILTQEANSQGYVQQMKNRISINKLGGKTIKKKKAFLGIANAIGDSIGGAINLIGSLANDPKDYTLKYTDPIQAQAPKVLKAPNDMLQQTNLAMQQVANPQMNLNQVQNPIFNQAKLGAKRIKQKNLNRFK